MKYECRDSIGAVFMIDGELKSILENLDSSQVYDYVLYNDEMSFMIDDMMEMKCNWYDVMIMLNMCDRKCFFSGKILSDSIKNYGCIAVIKSTEIVKSTLEVMLTVTKKEMERAYLKQKSGMMDTFENDWEFFNLLKSFYLNVIAHDRSAFLFC